MKNVSYLVLFLVAIVGAMACSSQKANLTLALQAKCRCNQFNYRRYQIMLAMKNLNCNSIVPVYQIQRI